MNSQIQKILDELYLLDPGLKKYHDELQPLIAKLLELRPAIEPNKKFIQKLREDILTHKKELSSYPAVSSPALSSNLYQHTMKNISYFLSGILAALVLILPTAYVYGPQIWPSGFLSQSFDKSDESIRITALDQDHAFGSLTDTSSAGPLSSSSAISFRSDPMAAIEAGPLEDSILPDFTAEVEIGAAGSSEMVYPETKMMAPPAEGLGGGGFTTDSMMVPPFDYVQYRYVYNGPALTAPSGKLPVYRRHLDGSWTSSLGNILGRTNFGLIDMGSFQNLESTHLTVNEDQDYGYSLTFDFQNESVSINKNWSRWPHPESQCADDQCYQSFQLDLSDMPPDADILSIATGFLRDKGLDLRGYGDPEVDNSWRVYYDQAPTPEQAYVPDIITVVYPRMIEGQKTYGSWGDKDGLRISVDIRNQRVSDVYALESQHYDSSQYDAITDLDQIMAMVERGGYDQWYYPDPNARLVDIQLGQPEEILIQIWKYDPIDYSSPNQTYFVPAWRFPIESIPDGADQYFYRQNVVVPLVQDFVQNDLQIIPFAQPRG